MSRTVLVVGGAGFIGSHCAWMLGQRGHRVVIYDNFCNGHRLAVRGELVEGDVRDRDHLVRTLREHRVEGVMHFAALANVGESVARPSLYFDVNVGGTAALLAAMAEAGVRHLVFSSSCSIYGTPRENPVLEHHPKAPESPYGLSKLIGEQLVDECRALEGLGVAALRYFNAAGALADQRLGESPGRAFRLIPVALKAALGQRGPLQVFGLDYDTPDGTCVRDYVHVLDLAEAHLLALERLWAGSPGGAWNLGCGEGHSVLEVLRAVERVTGLAVPWTPSPRRPGDPPRVWADPSAAARDLGWAARRSSLDEIVRSAWEWARDPAF